MQINFSDYDDIAMRYEGLDYAAFFAVNITKVPLWKYAK